MTSRNIPDIDKTIAQIRKRIDEKKRYVENRCVTQEFYDDIDHYMQLAGWLEELKEARKGFNENRKAGYKHGYSDGYNKAIDDVVERLSLEISESIIWDMLATMSVNGSLSDTSDKIVDYIIDTSKKIAEQLKGGSNDGK